LVITTLHATSTTQALDRLLYLFPKEHKQRVLMDLSLNLRGIVAQRLIKDTHGQLVLATEVLINTPFVSEVIRNGETQQLKDLLEKGAGDGMHSFDQSLVSLCKEGRISKEEAAENATSRNNLEWRLNFDEKSSTNSQLGKEATSFTDSGNHLPELEI
jgi:twitching motility protein PilU